MTQNYKINAHTMKKNKQEHSKEKRLDGMGNVNASKTN